MQAHKESDRTPGRAYVVTFDLFSALIDSRTGGGTALGHMAERRGWPVSGEQVYDHWDRRNKEAQGRCRSWVPFTDLAHAALVETYAELGLDGDTSADVDTLLDSLPDWPLWPDVHDGLRAVGERYRVGLLSNVDDALFARTRAHPLVEQALAMTSERLRAYKPDARIYRRARAEVGPMVHVATSARDVRGALEAGVSVVRLSRPGHRLDPTGPRPAHEADGVYTLPGTLARAWSVGVP